MKLLVSDKELAEYIISLIDFKTQIFPGDNRWYDQSQTNEILNFIVQEMQHPRFNLEKKRHKFKEKIYCAVRADLKKYFDTSQELIKIKKKQIKNSILNNLDKVLERLGENNVLDSYIRSRREGFVKTVGLQIDKNSKLIRIKNYQITNEPFLIRNTNANENLLIHRIKNKLPFWFIDSGYTNFIESNKKWHRLVCNHIHVQNSFDAPVDRLGLLSTFPQKWRNDGHYILIIEPGYFSSKIFGVNIDQWKKDIETEIKKHTDRPIKIREKINKKIRKNLYRELCDEDYHCVINLNSNAATEAIWAGIPAITLDNHITNSVTTNKISDINNLPKPHLANWLCMLSYSQFTYEELMDGTAYKILNLYHG
jgi:hypothetical protein